MCVPMLPGSAGGGGKQLLPLRRLAAELGPGLLRVGLGPAPAVLRRPPPLPRPAPLHRRQREVEVAVRHRDLTSDHCQWRMVEECVEVVLLVVVAMVTGAGLQSALTDGISGH